MRKQNRWTDAANLAYQGKKTTSYSIKTAANTPKHKNNRSEMLHLVCAVDNTRTPREKLEF